LAGLAGLWSGLWARGIILDDAMITFRVAENLAYGRGFVYNVGERVQVTTTPLYAIILAIGTWLFGSAPQAALVLNISLSILIPILAYDLGRRLAGRITGISAALLLTALPLLVIAFSMESYLYVTLLLASLDIYVMGRYRWAGLVVGLTALARGDAVLLGASMVMYDFLAHRRLHWPLIIPTISLPAAWYLFATLYYGSPFPATLSAKTAQGQFDWLGQHFLSGFANYWQAWLEDYSAWLYLFPVLMAVGLVWAIVTERRWLILIGRDLLYIATFVGLGVTFAEWYYAPLMPGVALLTGRGVQGVVEGITWPVSTQWAKRLISAALTAALIGLLWAFIYPISQDIITARPDWKAQVYPDVARWIAKNTTATATLATIDIGHLGYWSGRHIIDIVGLAQPDVPPQIAKGDFGYAIQHYQPDMVLIGAFWLPEIQTKSWFQMDYAPRHIFRFEEIDEPLILFTRREGVKVQSQTVPPAEIQPIQVDFNRQVRLAGYHFNRPLFPGSLLHLTLFWQVEAPIEVDFTIFVQLVDAANNIKSQGDSKPQRGFYPTPFWQPGEQITDFYTLPLNADLPPGNYDLLVGFYEASNGARLQVLDEAGHFKSDHVRISGVQVQPPPKKLEEKN
jgi:hypothetical protein